MMNHYIPGAPAPDAAPTHDLDPPAVDEFYAEGDINSSARGTGARANKGKVSLSLIPFHLLAGTARVLMGGAVKYAAWNWAKGMNWSTSMDCLLRHLTKWWYLGEDIDPDSGEHHLDHVLCNVFFLLHGKDTHLAGDDRPPQDVAHFAESMAGFVQPFDLEAFLDRNPDIRKLVEERRIEERRAPLDDNPLIPLFGRPVDKLTPGHVEAPPEEAPAETPTIKFDLPEVPRSAPFDDVCDKLAKGCTLPPSCTMKRAPRHYNPDGEP